MPTPPSAVTTTFWAGAATSVVTPPSSVFLFGYPHVPRASTGIHDQLETSALFLRHHDEKVIFISNDLILRNVDGKAVWFVCDHDGAYVTLESAIADEQDRIAQEETA